MDGSIIMLYTVHYIVGQEACVCGKEAGMGAKQVWERSRYVRIFMRRTLISSFLNDHEEQATKCFLRLSHLQSLHSSFC